MQDGQKDRSARPERVKGRGVLFTVRRGRERCENDADGVFHHPSRHDEQGVALLLAILVLALLVALILAFDSDARREYREAAAFRDNFKASVLTRAAVQAARAVLQMDHLKDKQT